MGATVTTGKIVNNKASSELPSTKYDLLWQSNSLDMILYYWTWVVYLTRLHCRGIYERLHQQMCEECATLLHREEEEFQMPLGTVR
eukprot:scaffold3987_cov134-Cylindrotheca_fusiformis.AAC.7